MIPRQPGKTDMWISDAQVPIPAEKFWEMRGRPKRKFLPLAVPEGANFFN